MKGCVQEELMRERRSWIDCARICAIFCVVLCHAVENFYGSVIRGEAQVGGGLWFAENTLFTIGRLGVPLFLAISGALLLERELTPGRFYRKSLLPLFVTTEIWIVLNYFFACVFQGMVFRLPDLISEMCFLRTLELSHMWYMPMILGIYLVLPFLSVIARSATDMKAFRLPYLIGIFAFVLIPTVNVFLSEAVPGGEPLKFKPELDFLGGLYGLYLFGGYFITRYRVLEKVKSRYLVLAAGLAFLLNTAGQYYLYINEYYKSSRLLWYSSFFIFVMGMILFEGIRRGFDHPQVYVPEAVEEMARCSFGIYLLHKPIQILVASYLPLERWNTVAGILLLLAAGLGISLLFLLLFKRRWRKAGRILFLIK